MTARDAPAPVANARFFATAADMRAWFGQRHDSERELWVGLYKKGTGLATVTMVEAIDQALCFGWIDGMKRTIDEKSYRVRFTPRRRRSSWSARNLKRMEELIAAGLVVEAGLAAWPGGRALADMKRREPGVSRCGRASLRTSS